MTSVLLIALYQNVKCVSYYNLENPLKHSHSFFKNIFLHLLATNKKKYNETKKFRFLLLQILTKVPSKMSANLVQPFSRL